MAGIGADAVAPIFPVRDIDAAVGHYRSLGFEVTGDHDGYRFARFGTVHLHLTEMTGLDPASSTSAAYLYVADADAVHAAWIRASGGGRLVAPVDQPWGLREGAHATPTGTWCGSAPGSRVRPAGARPHPP